MWKLEEDCNGMDAKELVEQCRDTNKLCPISGVCPFGSATHCRDVTERAWLTLLGNLAEKKKETPDDRFTRIRKLCEDLRRELMRDNEGEHFHIVFLDRDNIKVEITSSIR